MKELSIHLSDEAATVALGAHLAHACRTASIIYLHGDLGAGKTTLTRGFIQTLGHRGRVKSPTYTLVEPYEVSGWNVYHFDLYRLSAAEELEFMGIRDYFACNSLCMIEWPEKGEGILPAADLDLWLNYQGEERLALLRAQSQIGQLIIQAVSDRVA